MKKLIPITVMFVALTVLAMPALAKPPFMVVGTMNPAIDVPAVQNAVDNYEKVLLRGSFNFGYDLSVPPAFPPTNSVMITKDVKICGETDEDGMPMTTIYGGYWTFYAPLPLPAFFGAPFDPGPEITIKNIHFDGAVWTPIYISYTSGVEIKNNKITNVLPVGPQEIFERPNSYWQGGVYLMTLFDDPRNFIAGLEPAVVPNAITGPLVIKDNEVDLEVYPPYMPVDTMGQAVFVVWSWGANVDIKGNTLRNVTRNTIELLDNYKDDYGNGSITIKENNIVTAEEGINVPSNSTPNGIVVGWFIEPEPDPARTPEFSIKGNYVEGRGETSGGIVVISVPATIKDNEIMVKDGWIVDSGASGIMIWGEGTVASGNEITINPSTGAPGAAGSGILIASDYATVKENEIIFDDQVFSGAVGILQLASEGMISSNRIEGLGNVAVSLFPFFGPVQNNMISENDLEDFIFIPGWSDVFFYGGANYNTLVGEGGTVFDFGVGNVIIGDWTILP